VPGAGLSTREAPVTWTTGGAANCWSIQCATGGEPAAHVCNLADMRPRRLTSPLQRAASRPRVRADLRGLRIDEGVQAAVGEKREPQASATVDPQLHEIGVMGHVRHQPSFQ